MMTRFPLVYMLIALVMTGSLSGCRVGGRPSVELAAEPGFDAPLNGLAVQSVGSLRLAGAIGEVLGVHFTVRAGNSAIAAPTLLADTFQSRRGTIDASAIEIFRLHAVSVDHWPGWHIRSIPVSRRNPAPLDVLVPLDAPRGGIPNLLSPGATYHFWADVHIPMGVPDGTYRSRIVLFSGEREIGAIDLELTVWPIVLPREIGFDTIAELDHAALIAHHLRGEQHRKSETSAVETRETLLNALRQMRRHRIAGVYPMLAPGVGISGSTRLTLDWQQFDDLVGPVLSGETFEDRSPTKRWPIPIHAALPLKIQEPPSRRRLLSRYLVEAIQHFDDRQWNGRAYLLSRDPASGETLSALEVARLIGSSRNQVHVVVTDPPHTFDSPEWTENEELHNVIDEWAPTAQFLDRRTVLRERDAGKATWFCADHPPFSGSLEISAPPTYARVLAWQAASIGASQLYLGRILAWPNPGQIASPTQCVRAFPGNLLYPGTTFGLVEPVMSLRLKRLRRGLQDVAYLRLLREHGRSAIADRVLSSIVSAVGAEAYDAHNADGSQIGWPNEEGAFDAARRVMAEEMLRVVASGKKDSGETEFSRTAAWRRLNQMTRQPMVIAEGVRMHMTGSPAHPLVTIASHARIESGSLTRQNGVFRLEDWPKTWQVDAPIKAFRGSSNRASRQRVSVETVVALESVSFAASLDLKGVAEFDSGRRATSLIPLRCVTALRCGRPPTIDGDLSDWPMGTTNVMTRFRSIAGAAGDDPSTVRVAKAPTVAFVMRDDSYLYIAINAATKGLMVAETRSRKAVNYDDAIPVGEELIELLFDPLNTATRSPESIYHIVIKRSGSDLAEKGIDLRPPVGKRVPWAADADVAVSKMSDRWTAEVRIPLSSFGVGPFRNVFWGFNVTRFDAANSEYSTWSAAKGNAYDPTSFGNLLLSP